METNKLNDEELEQINGGVYCPASSGIVDSRDKIVFRFNTGDIVNFKGGITGGFIKGVIVTPVYSGSSKGIYYPSYIVESFLNKERISLKQDQIYIQY